MKSLVVSIVLNLDRRADTLACLASIEGNTYGRIQVLVLDAGSTDGSVQAVREAFPAASVVELRENLGYAGNNNVGITAALDRGADWVLLLNEDTLLDRHCIERLVLAGESDPRIGVLGPMVYHADEPTVIQSAGGRIDGRWVFSHLGQNQPDAGQFEGPRDVDWISGCAILVRRRVIDEVGPLDARFFYYYEETEWCVRAAKAGWRIVHVPAARLWHKGVQRDYHPPPSVTYYATRNRLLMLRKHHAPVAARAVAWAQLLRTFASWSLRPKWQPMREHRDALWHGVRDFSRGRWGQMPER